MEFKCELCEGTGVVKELCGYCNGSGEGMIDSSRCRFCKGSGTENWICNECLGHGEKLDVETE
jgi:RecJ-like exonuclease